MKKISFLLFTSLALFAARPTAFAHIGYGGRDFGTLTVGSPVTISNQTVSSSFGWADATDSDYGDSHRTRAFRFTLASTTSVSISAERNSLGTGANGLFLPAFSLFQGLGQLAPEQGGHDAAALSVNSRPGGTEGSMLSLADWSIGNDPTYNTPGDPQSGILFAARLATFTYVGHAADGASSNYGSALGISGDGTADGSVTTTFHNLPAGNYSLFIGGANYSAQDEEVPTYPTYGVTATVEIVPEPSSGLLVAVGAAVLALIRRARRLEEPFTPFLNF